MDSLSSLERTLCSKGRRLANISSSELSRSLCRFDGFDLVWPSFGWTRMLWTIPNELEIINNKQIYIFCANKCCPTADPTVRRTQWFIDWAHSQWYYRLSIHSDNDIASAFRSHSVCVLWHCCPMFHILSHIRLVFSGLSSIGKPLRRHMP